MKRLFLAIPIPEIILKEISQQKEKLNLPLKWIPEKNLHVTVHFFGDVEEINLDQLKQNIRHTSDHTSPLMLETNSMIIKSGKFQNMIWVTFKTSPQFESLGIDIAKSIGIEKIRKPLPHINLVRSKSKIISPNFPHSFPPLIINVNHIELWESKLSPAGSTYSSLESFILKGEG